MNWLQTILDNTFEEQPDGTFATKSGMLGMPAEPIEDEPK